MALVQYGEIGHELGVQFAVYRPGSLGYRIQGAVEETHTLVAESLNARVSEIASEDMPGLIASGLLWEMAGEVMEDSIIREAWRRCARGPAFRATIKGSSRQTTDDAAAS